MVILFQTSSCACSLIQVTWKRSVAHELALGQLLQINIYLFVASDTACAACDFSQISRVFKSKFSLGAAWQWLNVTCGSCLVAQYCCTAHSGLGPDCSTVAVACRSSIVRLSILLRSTQDCLHDTACYIAAVAALAVASTRRFPSDHFSSGACFCCKRADCEGAQQVLPV